MGGFFGHPIGFVILYNKQLYYIQRMRQSRDKMSTFSNFLAFSLSLHQKQGANAQSGESMIFDFKSNETGVRSHQK